MFLILDKDKYQVRPLTNMSDTVHTCEANQQQPKKAECPFFCWGKGPFSKIDGAKRKMVLRSSGAKPPLELRT